MRVPLRAAGMVALSTLVLTGCATTPPSTGTEHANTATHVHAIVANPDGDGFLLGTHESIYTATDDGELGTRIGVDFDAMGLTVVGEDLIASGHPGPNTPAELGKGNLGIIRSRDGAGTWQPVAFTSEKDFHALTVGPDGTLYGQATDSSDLLVSIDLGATWTPTSASLLAFGLAADAAGRLIATTPNRPQVSTDGGKTFVPLTGAPNLYVIATSADHERIVGVDDEDVIWTNTVGGPA
ncbi:hypothetical protein ACWKWN_18200 [Microbacterium trichothecenolyticum]